jgi:hypothetical protein
MGELLGLRQSGIHPVELEGELDLLLAARDLVRADEDLARRLVARERVPSPIHVP